MTSLTLVRQIPARPSTVFRSLTSAEDIGAWWGPDDLPATVKELDVRVGGVYRIRFRTLDGREHEVFGEYLVVSPPTRLVWTWNYVTDGGGEPEEYGRTSQVEVVLRPVGEGATELTFTHDELKNEVSKESHTWGWTGSLVRMERLLAAAYERDRA